MHLLWNDHIPIVPIAHSWDCRSFAAWLAICCWPAASALRK